MFCAVCRHDVDGLSKFTAWFHVVFNVSYSTDQQLGLLNLLIVLQLPSWSNGLRLTARRSAHVSRCARRRPVSTGSTRTPSVFPMSSFRLWASVAIAGKTYRGIEAIGTFLPHILHFNHQRSAPTLSDSWCWEAQWQIMPHFCQYTDALRPSGKNVDT